MRRTVALISNPQKPQATRALDEVRTLLREHGTLVGEASATSTRVDDAIAAASVIVVLGGDGTLLGQARLYAGPTTALLGVNMGRLGFLTAYDLPALRQHAPALLSDASTPLPVRSSNLLRVRLFGEGSSEARFESLALNDAVITAGPPYRLITLSLSIDGREGPTMRGDGLIIASPLGSTAYNLSAGGPILAPEVDAFAITPIAAQSLSFRPVVVPGSSTIRVVAVRTNRERGPDGAGTTLVLDGQIHTSVLAHDRIEISRHEHGARFVTNPASDWWARLMGKFHWAASPPLR